MIISFLLLPVVMFACTMFFLSVGTIMLQVAINEKCCKITSHKFIRANFVVKFLIVLLNIVEGCISLSLAAAGSVILVGVTIIPAYIYQFYKIFKIIHLWSFKSYDRKRREIQS